jgi:hypothetical protein
VVKDLPMKSLMSRPGLVTSLPVVGHPVGQVAGLLVAPVRADQVGVVDIGVIDVFAGLHLRLQLLDHVAFADQVVGDLDAGDLGEGLGQHLGFIFVGRMVSDTTLISMPAKGFAASMNHCISFSWSARESATGPISLSRNALASSMSARPGRTSPASAGPSLMLKVLSHSFLPV